MIAATIFFLTISSSALPEATPSPALAFARSGAAPRASFAAARAESRRSRDEGEASGRGGTVKPVLPDEVVASKSLEEPALPLVGDDVVYDFQGQTLHGSDLSTLPDARSGLGVLVKGKNVTIKNLKVRGFKVGLMAEGAHGLKLINCDFSYNWKQRLKSTQEAEDLGDWMSFHQNEKDEWLRFGAGIYLRDCDRARIQSCTIVGGQCGLMMTECDDSTVLSNTFSYLSAIGVGMYRSSRNRIVHNDLSYCVRGYSHGVYNRGQDSAAILVYEQSNKNVFAYNQATHSGDGFFLWAGQTTMDTGKGGCNDNLVYGNDFSYSPTNGIEATFSRNQFINNLMIGCWHGVWGGYSYDSLFEDNVFIDNDEAIAIEHGQSNLIRNNRIAGGKLGVYLWANASQDPNWVYPKVRYTANFGTVVEGNLIQSPTSLRLVRSDSLELRENEITGRVVLEHENKLARFVSKQIADLNDLPEDQRKNNQKWEDPAMSMWQFAWSPRYPEHRRAPQRVPGAFMPSGYGLGDSDRPGRESIRVDEWGPLDYRFPVAWPVRNSDPEAYEVVGPTGRWKVKKAPAGVVVKPSSGLVGDRFTVSGKVPHDLQIELEFVGDETTDFRGIRRSVGVPVAFYVDRFNLALSWAIKHWNYDVKQRDPRKPETNFEDVFTTKPDAERQTKNLNLMMWNEPVKGMQKDFFATEAKSEFEVQAGTYVLEVISDDGCRVELDGVHLIDEWKYQGPTTYRREVKLGGKHAIRVRHFELDGFSQLTVRLLPVRR